MERREASVFKDRRQGGIALAEKLLAFADSKPIVYALPRGGLPVAEEVARRLRAPLDLIFVRKLGAPGQQELAIGAVVDGAAPTLILHDNVIAELGVPAGYIENAKHAALEEIERRRKLYLKDAPPVSPKGRTVIIVDDGLATGATMEAAAAAMRKAGAETIVAAVPVASREAAEALTRLADRVVCVQTPFPFSSVGAWYEAFAQLTDEDVVEILARRQSFEAP